MLAVHSVHDPIVKARQISGSLNPKGPTVLEVRSSRDSQAVLVTFHGKQTASERTPGQSRTK